MLMRRVRPARPMLEHPFEFDQLRRGMLRLLDAAVGHTVGDMAVAFPSVNITQDDSNFYVRAELPGIKPDDLSISVVRNRISLAGKREIEKEHERVYHRKERAEGSFSRAVTLPAEVDAEHVDARYSEGVLTITLPKADQAKPRQIAVKT
ncbi:MAG TPA: Hsp20/alpha crystallin family protein [Anaeromyxobacteraceae bacterium]|nr:Hsp20/alpha crystallin family protein [Anaeromyxobacteraceae bacterium]